MPYKALEDLPESVQHVLPKHAQEIYLEAYNHARRQYWFRKNRRDPHENLEQVAHKVAWSAVKWVYEKGESGGWHRRKDK